MGNHFAMWCVRNDNFKNLMVNMTFIEKQTKNYRREGEWFNMECAC